jgi:hypothetical protein
MGHLFQQLDLPLLPFDELLQQVDDQFIGVDLVADCRGAGIRANVDAERGRKQARIMGHTGETPKISSIYTRPPRSRVFGQLCGLPRLFRAGWATPRPGVACIFVTGGVAKHTLPGLDGRRPGRKVVKDSWAIGPMNFASRLSFSAAPRPAPHLPVGWALPTILHECQFEVRTLPRFPLGN